MLLPTNVLVEIIPSNVTADSGSKVLPKTVQTNQRCKWSQECFNKRQKSCVCWRGGRPPRPFLQATSPPQTVTQPGTECGPDAQPEQELQVGLRRQVPNHVHSIHYFSKNFPAILEAAVISPVLQTRKEVTSRLRPQELKLKPKALLTLPVIHRQCKQCESQQNLGCILTYPPPRFNNSQCTASPPLLQHTPLMYLAQKGLEKRKRAWLQFHYLT